MASPSSTSAHSAAPGWLARHRGGVALGISALGFAGSELCVGLGWLPAPWGGAVVTAFEGALVGSVADWFAVTALFKQFPIPGLRRHTGLIANRREALSRGIVDMAEREWLSPAALRARLATLSFADLLTQRLYNGEGREQLRRLTRQQSRKLLGWLDDPRLESMLEPALARAVERIDSGQQLAPLLQRLAYDRTLNEQLWQGALYILDRVLADPQLLNVLSDILLDQLDALSSEGKWSSVKVWLGKQFLEGEDDREKAERLLRRLLGTARQHLEEIEQDQHHPLRLRMRALLVVTARHLRHGEGGRLRTVLERSKWQLYHSFRERRGISGWLAFLKRWIAARIDNEQSLLNRCIDRGVDQLFQRYLIEPQARQRFDERVRTWAGDLIDEHPGAVGSIVRESLSEANMPTSQLVATIEEKVGPDLQWIRVNGALVGGAVALAIGLVRALVTWVS
ncbi:DUF445 domain-containing protein [Carnimonas nigrificans]|uniref:DUF445 domain-containing protein n=1 Tax=Carnimonas nigrificans TaxID=64323 RepID=UPI0004710D80|nr:DUF445 domain-containing protein [Carnimonas nigrificans]